VPILEEEDVRFVNDITKELMHPHFVQTKSVIFNRKYVKEFFLKMQTAVLVPSDRKVYIIISNKRITFVRV